jgi:hypothetical protein
VASQGPKFVNFEPWFNEVEVVEPLHLARMARASDHLFRTDSVMSGGTRKGPIMLRRSVIAAAAAAFLLPAAAQAEGPGQYRIKGVDARSKAEYSGTAQLTQTGEGTWRIVWRIGGQTWNASGVGDSKVIAANFSAQGSSGVFLMVAKDGGGYQAVWNYTNSTTVGTEEWSKGN